MATKPKFKQNYEIFLDTLASIILESRDNYGTLQVAPNAASETIKDSHRKLSSLFQPDRCKHPQALDVSAQLHAAYGVLKNKDARQKYDMIHMGKVKQCAACHGKGSVNRQKGFGKKVSTTCQACKGAGREL